MKEYTWPEHFSALVARNAFGNKLCGYLISLEAWRRGLEVRVESRNCDKFEIYSISSLTKSLKFNRSKVSLTSMRAVRITKHKDLTKKYLRKYGVATPAGAKFSSNDEVAAVLEYASKLGYPVVLKPISGSLGRGVYSGLKCADELAYYCHHLRDKLGVTDFVVEKHFQGEDYRIFATRDKVIAAVKRIPANVSGDGESTIDKLITDKNYDRKQNPFLSKGLIKRDDEVLQYIRTAGYTLNSILPAGQVLSLRGKANASAGGDVIDMTDRLPDSVKAAAISSIRAIPELEYCGVDIIYNEDSGDFCVIELNSRAQIGVNMYPTHGVGQDIPKAIIDAYFPEAPKTHDEINPHLVFDVDTVLSPMLTGAVSSVTIAPAEEYADFDRKYVRFKKCHIKSRVDLEKKLRKLVGEYSIIGRAKRKAGQDLELYIAGDNEKLTSFIESVEEVIEHQGRIIKKWVGVVKQGFYISIEK